MNKYVVSFCLLACTLLAQADPRQWPGQGVQLHRSNPVGFADKGQTAADAAGNVIAVWSDLLSGQHDIRAQLIAPDGHTLWDSSGLSVCTEIHEQAWPFAVATSGGFIVVWADYRAQPYRNDLGFWGGDLRAQKIATDGTLLWSATDRTGVPVDVSDHSVRAIRGVFSDDSGGALVLWHDLDASDSATVCVQRLNSAGATVFPVPVRLPLTDGAAGDVFTACGDGDDGAFVAWTSMADNPHFVRVQRVTADGQVPWGPFGVAVLPGIGSFACPALCADGAGGCFVECAGTDNYPHLQRLTRLGAPLWGTGITAPQRIGTGLNGLVPSFNGDDADGCLLAGKRVNPDNYTDLVSVQKLDLNGNGLWGDSGSVLCDEAAYFAGMPTIVSDHSGGVIAARYVYPNAETSGAYVSRLDAGGASVWTACSRQAVLGHRLLPAPEVYLTAATGRVLLPGYEFLDESTFGSTPFYQQLSLATGDRALADSGKVLVRGIAGGGSAQGVALSAGRYLTCWTRSENGRRIVVYQILHENGSGELPQNGAPLLDLTDEPSSADPVVQSLCPDGHGGAFAVVFSGYYQNFIGRLTRMDSTGHRVGPADGVTVVASDIDHEIGGLSVVSDGGSGCFVGWAEYAYEEKRYDVVQYGANLQPLWDGPVTLVESNGASLLTSQTGSCMVVDYTYVTDHWSARATRISSARQILWTSTVVDSFPGDVFSLQAAADREGGVYISGTDARFSGADVFAQHLSAAGVEAWPHNGIVVRSGEGSHYLMAMAVDRDNHLYLGWEDVGAAQSYPLVVQRVRPNGSLCWDPHGVAAGPLSAANGTVSFGMDGHDHLTALWPSTSATDVYAHVRATQLDSTGQTTDPYWIPFEGNRIADSLSRTDWPQLVADSHGGALALYVRSPVGGPYYDDAPGVCAQLLLDAAQAAPPRSSAMPRDVRLDPAFPNPFNPATRITFALPQAGMTTLAVYDLLGRQVATLTNGTLAAGEHTVTFDAGHLASGVYFYRLDAGGVTATRKLLLLK